MLFAIVNLLGVQVILFFEWLPANNLLSIFTSHLPVDKHLYFIAGAEGRQLIQGLMKFTR